MLQNKQNVLWCSKGIWSISAQCKYYSKHLNNSSDSIFKSAKVCSIFKNLGTSTSRGVCQTEPLQFRCYPVVLITTLCPSVAWKGCLQPHTCSILTTEALQVAQGNKLDSRRRSKCMLVQRKHKPTQKLCCLIKMHKWKLSRWDSSQENVSLLR